MAPANIKNFEIKIGKTGVVIMALGMSALLFVAFLFGVDVGKNIDTYPEKIAAIPQQVMDVLWRPQKIHIDVDDSHANQKVQSKEGDIDLTFYNALTNKKGDPKTESMQDEANVVGNLKRDESVVLDFNDPGKSSESASEGSKKNPVEPVRAEEKQESKTPSKTTEKEEPQLSVNHDHFVIQAASLKEKKKAEDLNKKVSSLGYKSSVVKAELEGKGTVYRIMVSGFASKHQAVTASEKISKKIGTKCIVRNTKHHEK
ncbi:MAG TPA: SPOR domain-containing protein [Smithella sp.]|nr:SPOR domain-containing protein [Smithella sp.]